MRPNVILLVSAAPEVRKWHKLIYDELLLHYDVTVVIDSAYTKKILKQSGVPYHYCFADYFEEKHSSNDRSVFDVQQEYSHINIWESYFSDFERNELFFKFRKPFDQYHDWLIACLYSFFHKVFSERKTEALVYENVSNSFAYAAYNVSQNFGARYVGIVLSRFPGRFEIYESNRSNAEAFEEAYRSFDNKADLNQEVYQQALNYVSDLQQKNMVIEKSMHADIGFIKRYFTSQKVQNFYGKLKNLDIEFDSTSRSYAYQIRSELLISLKAFKKFFYRRLRLFLLRNKFSKNVLDMKESFYLYPLHYHPESSTSVHARYYINEVETIINIAFNLPFGTKLYVKDHPVAAGAMSLDQYRRLLSIPNVRLVHYNTDIKELIKRSEGVITLTGSVGFEAILYNKPVIVLGDVFYNRHPLCHRVEHFDELWHITSRINEQHLKKNYNPVQAVYAAFATTFEGTEEQVGKVVVSALAASEAIPDIVPGKVQVLIS